MASALKNLSDYDASKVPNAEEMKYLANMWMQLVPLPSLENF